MIGARYRRGVNFEVIRPVCSPTSIGKSERSSFCAAPDGRGLIVYVCVCVCVCVYV
jgi:hypothetical protein